MSSGPQHTRMVDLEDPAYAGKNIQQIEKAVWEKDVAELKALGVNVAPDHMDGYLFQPERKEFNLDQKPWETNLCDKLPAPKCEVTLDTWNNLEFLLEVEAGVAYMKINRPEANNSINDNVKLGLSNAVDILQERPDVRVATLTGAGRMFCAGIDPMARLNNQPNAGEVMEGAPPKPDQILRESDKYSEKKTKPDMTVILYKVSNMSQFTICCLNGSAMAGGVGFTTVCDMVIAVKAAYITISEVKLGMIPAAFSPHIIGKMGVRNAKRLFCTGENLKAADAVEIGLVQQVVDNKEAFDAVIKDVCGKIQQTAPEGLKMSKDLMTRTMNGTMSNSLMEYLAESYVKSRKGPEAMAAMQALTEKKKPSWMEVPIVPRALTF